MIVTLTWPEMYTASDVGVMRQLGNLRRNVRPRYGASEDEGVWDKNMLGCQAEMAVAKALNLFWSGAVGDYTAIDVGHRVEVRAIGKVGHRLMLHETDRDLPFVLVLAKPPVFELLGWIFAGDGKRDEFWCDPARGRPAYFVPTEALNTNIDELTRYVHDQVAEQANERTLDQHRPTQQPRLRLVQGQADT